ncbi:MULTISPECIES: tripartite tricarboxylate transporter TctB family protein [unclassified Hahella]|uniref:tripartite tricarboxylate transporter TctB family protein n=1 Tax=unclassified Hahella TaxID=2624107 RepID=UPI000FDF4838|nr:MULTISPECIES: tripartite tricarboxylate transporter TctB family protein [unclassified Hahella]AZZ93791.1 tripartite tricarboxylate transporter TctB family protein [Hahella sp. KA22]MBU6954907.1 tripartite tricarboxylate transporter TctB family protein [Hahella sp. HN01]MDG9669677.1 tripartite tricarboxylate transporter TctB family protein [Hahella sp. CR1]QAY57164.1 tripartite tricarboxylate transporter TctB family protein [Hahella sp. KA22]
MNDRIFGLVMLVLAIAYGWGAYQLPEPFGGNESVGPETFPILLSVVLGLSSLYLMLRPDPDNHWPWNRTGAEMVVAVVVLTLYGVLLEPLGFIITTTLAVGTLSWRMGARKFPAYMSGLIGGVVVFVLFNYVLELPLPLGVLEVS